MTTPIVTTQNLGKTFGLAPIFEELSFSIFDHSRIGIIGPNGAGKSTLLKILATLEEPDQGSITFRRGLRVSYVAQTDLLDLNLTVEEQLTRAISPHERDQKLGLVREILQNAGFQNPQASIKTLSGGWRKRLAVCSALITDPDLLLLDEPTNHLDLEGILWLEDTLVGRNKPFIIITHDRYFLDACCDTVMEISRSYPRGFLSIEGGYGEFRRRKQETLQAQSSELASLTNKARREQEWLQRGAQARSTKQRARIQSAEDLQKNLESTTERTRQQATQFAFQSSQRKTKRLVELDHCAFQFGDRALFKDLSVSIGPQVCLGIAGANGSGKTTLLKVIQGLTAPTSGTIFHADQLRIVYFDQYRADLSTSSATIRQILCDQNDLVRIGDRSLHVSSYIRNFRFRPEQLDTPAAKLSGGERAKLLIAMLLLQPADLLILDEPTNDLDVDTLEVLEESLQAFPGAVLLVTHDRYLMGSVATGLLGLSSRGNHGFFADYEQYLTWQRLEDALKENPLNAKKQSRAQQPHLEEGTGNIPPSIKKTSPKKLSYLEQRDWDTIESRISDAETSLQEAQAKTMDPAISADAARLLEACKDVESAQQQVDLLYQRWSDLEQRLK